MKIKIIDLFCGAGGLTSGAKRVENVEVIACVNHDDVAIESHKANHPEVIHFVEDVRNPTVIDALAKLVAEERRKDPGCKIILCMSAECTHYSKAKGGGSRDADSRSLPRILYQLPPDPEPDEVLMDGYIQAIQPDGIWSENVEEFMSWGPVRIKEDFPRSSPNEYCALKFKNDKEYHIEPLSKKKGQYYLSWIKHIEDLGYKYSYKILSAADFGACQKRERYFGQFVKKDLPFYWPTPTHSKSGNFDVFGSTKPHRAVKEVLDFSDKGESIFKPGKIRSEKTFERILAGLVKYVAQGDDSFIKKYFSGRPKGKVKSTEDPSSTITTWGGGNLVQVAYVNSTTIDLITPKFLIQYNGKSKAQPTDGPCNTIPTKDRFSAVWLDKQYGGTANHQSVETPAGAVLVNDKHCLMQTFIVKNFSSGGQHNSVDGPCGSLVKVPKENLVQLEGWILDTNFNNNGKSIEEPAPTVLACRKHHYLVNPQYSSKGGDTDNPCFTLIARMDKAPPYLVQLEERNDLAILIYEEDPEPVKKIKLFMAVYGITDIYMRMLRIDELLAIQGFPPGYILKGTKTQKKKFIGNAVEVNMGEALIRAQAEGLTNFIAKVA